MFPHTITLYRHWVENDTDHYQRQVVEGVYWSGSVGVLAGDKAADKQDQCTVITSPETTAGFGSMWTVCRGDRILYGEGPEICSFADLKNALTVKKVDVAVCGSPMDNITITGE